MGRGGKRESAASVLAAVVAAAFVLFCFFALECDFFLCALLSIGLFAGIFLLAMPSAKVLSRMV